MNGTLYLNPRQASDREPTAWENEFADVIEAAFASGVRELDALVAALALSRVRPREGGPGRSNASPARWPNWARDDASGRHRRAAVPRTRLA